MNTATRDSSRSTRLLRAAIWGGALALLLLPLVAMRFTAEVAWTASDFVTAALLLGATALGLDRILHSQRSRGTKWAFAGLVVLLFLLVWAELAVGLTS